MRNSKISYMYRDASNYKQFNEVIVQGVIKEDELRECLDSGECFIPDQVGLEELQERMSHFPNDDDHVWHELEEIELTDEEPTIEMNSEQLLQAFKDAFEAGWDVTGAVKRLGIPFKLSIIFK